MSDYQTTLFAHIFNEEYLLPVWLEHHKKLFDNIVIVDYRSTDSSIEICKRICPDCTIITTRNEYFGAEDVDNEMMMLENSTPGIKMILNITEYLFCKKPLKECFMKTPKLSVDRLSSNTIADSKTSYAVIQYMVFSKTSFEINPNDYTSFFKNVLNDDVVFLTERGTRQLHNFSNGNYRVGRHATHNPITYTDEIHILWCGYFPINENILKRKLQIKQNIPQKDKDAGAGFHHLWSREQILSVYANYVNNGVPLVQLNKHLHDLICDQYNK
jgi:hypothetical protein